MIRPERPSSSGGYRMNLLMRPVEHSVAVGVRDELGRVESTVTNLYEPTRPVT